MFAKQGKNREGGPGRKLRQQFDVGQIRGEWSDTNCLLSRWDLKPGEIRLAVFLFQALSLNLFYCLTSGRGAAFKFVGAKGCF